MSRHSDYNLIIPIILTVLVILVRLPSLEEPFDRDSAANAYGARLIVQGEPLYTSYHPGHHLPAVYYVYALAFSLFGDRLFAVKFFLLLWMIPTTYLFYHLARRFTDARGSWLAVILFLLFSSERFLKGTTAEIELFANLPRVGAALLLLILVKRNAASWQFVFVGLLGAVCILFKAVYLSPLALSGGVLLLEFWGQRGEEGSTARLLKRSGWIGAGFVAGISPVIIYFGMLKLLPRLGLVFALGQAHVSDDTNGPIFLLLYPIMVLGVSNLPNLVIGLTGALLMLRDRTMPAWERSVIPLWLVLSWVEAGFSRKPFPHYDLLVIPPLTLLSAWWLIRLHRVVKNKSVASMVSALLLLSIGIAYIYHNGAYLNSYIRYKIGQETYQAFVLRAPYGFTLITLQDVADYIQAHSTPEERIYLWGTDVQVYYLANRRCALDFIWPHFVESPVVPGGPEEMRRRLLAPSTKYIVVTQDDPPAWLSQGLAENYRLAETIEEWDIYRRADSESIR